MNGDPVVHQRTFASNDESIEPIAQADGDSWAHYFVDPIGFPERLLDGSGREVWEARRHAWRATASGQVVSTPVRSPGQLHDDEASIAYNRWRYFDGECGRFLSSDPAGLRGGINEFAYAPNPRR